MEHAVETRPGFAGRAKRHHGDIVDGAQDFLSAPAAGRHKLEAAGGFGEDRGDHGVGLMVRVPHSSGLLEGCYTRETTFGKDDHRFFRVSSDERKKAWLDAGLRKVDKLRFLTEGTGRTMAQAAIRWILAEPCFACVLPNIYNEDQLREFAAASDAPDLSPADVRRVNELYARSFDLEPASV